MKLRIATRKSALALAQTRVVAAGLCSANPSLEIEEIQIVTEGDRVQEQSLSSVGGKALFVKELEAAVLEKRADLAVHSMKDLPATLAPGLCIAAVPERETPFDVLVSPQGGDLASLKPGTRVGTSSQRRAVQLKAARADIEVVPLRGNVDTRLKQLAEGEFGAIVLAEAGLRRLGLVETVRTVRLDRIMIPAVGQGALALECRDGDRTVLDLCYPLHHARTATETRAEREVMRLLGADCTVPLGALATLRGGRVSIRGFYANESGQIARAELTLEPSTPERIGAALAEALREKLRA